jgi:uncharacterized protein
MNADLERLMALQALDSRVRAAERALASEPDRLQALDARLDAARQHVVVAKDRAAHNQSARRELEKSAAVHQGRLSKFRDQAMAVKTNQEYQAIQHEIAFAQTEIKSIEDKELELMMEADDLTANLKRTEAAFAAEQKTVESERKTLSVEHAEMEARVTALGAERASVVSGIAPAVLSLFTRVSQRRNGVAMAEARDGICTICHVRLRPQVFNTVLRNEDVVQCDSCQRILYFVPAPAAGPAMARADS